MRKRYSAWTAHGRSARRTKVSEYGEHAPVIVVGFVKVELLEDLTHMSVACLRLT
jgi:hypothetical protein